MQQERSPRFSQNHKGWFFRIEESLLGFDPIVAIHHEPTVVFNFWAGIATVKPCSMVTTNRREIA
jgi:hypothetical protein